MRRGRREGLAVFGRRGVGGAGKAAAGKAAGGEGRKRDVGRVAARGGRKWEGLRGFWVDAAAGKAAAGKA
ncbi:MAG TPA: hypothetical protein VHE54_07605, partial [Puia sp.]|nr:hypothetical protein [Puia sp.]